MKHIDLYTDGACSGNPGPGGWGAILIYEGIEKEMSGGCIDTTNNRMELTAVIEGLNALKMPCEVTVYSDSQYVINAMTKGWAESWRAKGWVKSDKKPALNADLWEKLLNLCELHRVSFIWVRGHADNEYNNRCDKLAVNAIPHEP
ncbi:MAG: ribonuclease HI [Oscillospiraceae bacterium]|nr:ribonuclease HI [Oscillospiraceae bacterium]